MTELKLDTLREGFPAITVSVGGYLHEASCVALSLHGHPNKVHFEVSGTENHTFEIVWDTEVSRQALSAWADHQVLAEQAACGIAIVLILQTTDLVVVERAKKGTAVDYWIGPKDGFLFQRSARLEVSGILDGDSSEIGRRVTEKLKRFEEMLEKTSATDGGLPLYVVVVEFSRPTARMVRKENGRS